MPWLELQPVFGPSLLQENHPKTTLLLYELQVFAMTILIIVILCYAYLLFAFIKV